MHSKNPFNSPYNFDILIEQNPQLKPFVYKNLYGTQTIKFGNNEAVKALNAALLKTYFGIAYWDIPDNHLCPPIPGRLDYLLHVADLIPRKDVHLLDIGTGANLIYPILATQHFNWKTTASEVNLGSLSNAKEIINKNTAIRDIELRHQPFKRNVLDHIIHPGDFFDIVVCNPPFFKNRTEAHKNNKRKYQNLQLKDMNSQNFGGLSNELWYKGGEEAFIKIMAEESDKFKNQVHWFTAVISRKDNVRNIKRAIKKYNPSDMKVVTMEQGNKQSRFIAWTFKE